MTLYPRSDLMSVGIPTDSGGCGNTHIRPVNKGVPVKIWKLDCPPCESYLRGDTKAKVIKVIPGDKDNNIPSRMEHVVDADPHWSTTPEGVPLTPDEQHVHKIRSERGRQDLDMLQAIASLRNTGIDLGDYRDAMWLLEQRFDKRIIHGSMVCAAGHNNAAGVKFCQECGISMTTLGIIDATEEDDPEPAEPFIDVYKLDFKSLQKMCKEKGLSARGTADQLRQRLTT